MGNKSSKTKLKSAKFNIKKQSISTNENDIIIKCGLDEMVKRFFKDVVIVWHDPNVCSQENKQYKVQLEKFCQVETFTEWEKASRFIQGTTAICHVITSGTNGELLVKAISLSQNISNIYIFCGNKDYHSTWAKNYAKVACVETQIQRVFDQIEQNLLKWYKEASSLRLNLPAFAPIFDDWDKSEMNNLHRYLKVLPNFRNRSQAKNDFLALSKAIYSDKHNTALIASFERNYKEYNKEVILKWYTQESFLYKVTNNCLRIASCDSIQYCRLLLKDIERAIKEHYKEKSKHFSGALYRGAYLSQEEWESLKGNLGREIEMHGFLSVSKLKNVALNFMKMNPSDKVFITILVPKGPNEEEQGFAEVEEFSMYPQEKEILFNVKSRFTVLEAEDPCPEDLPYRHLVLLYGARGFRRFVTEENPVKEISIPNVESISCSVCSCCRKSTKIFFKPIADLSNQVYFCQKCCLKEDNTPLLCFSLMNNNSRNPKVTIKGFMLNYPIDLKLPMYGYKCSKCQERYQEMYFKCTECSSSERKEVWCENCWESQMDCLQQGHGIVLESSPFSFWCERMSENELNHMKFQDGALEADNTFQQAQMYFENSQYEKAIEYYNIYLQQHEHNKDDSSLACVYNNLGLIYDEQEEYKKALEYFFKGLKANKSSNKENLCWVSLVCGHIGIVYGNQGEYKKALEYHYRSLELRKSVDGESSSEVADTYNNLALICYKQGEMKKSLEYMEKSLEIYKLLYGNSHPRIASSMNNIGNIYQNQGDLEKALEFFSKGLELRKSLYGDNHLEVASSYNNVGEILISKGEFNEAFEYISKALKVAKSFVGENHSLVAMMFNNLGEVFTGQGEYQKALECYYKALEAWDPVYKSSHSEIATCYNYIGVAYENLGQYEKALQYLSKALKIRESIYGDKHFDIASSYTNIGSVFYHQGELNKALEYLEKGLKIRKAVFGNNHYEIATSYYKIGLVYGGLKQYEKAREYYSKALGIRSSVFGENRPFTIRVRNQVEMIAGKRREYSDLEIRRG